MSTFISVVCESCGHTTRVRQPESYEVPPTDGDVLARNVVLIADAIAFARAHSTEEGSARLLRLLDQ